MPQDLAQAAKDRGIKYFLISFVDLFGVLRSKLVPARAIGDMQKDGAGFAGFAAWLDMTPAHPDMFAIPDLRHPDPAALEARGRLAGRRPLDGRQGGRGLAAYRPQAPDRQGGQAGLPHEERRRVRVLPDHADGTAISDDRDIQEKPCYDQSALMRRYDVISQICDCMIDLGWGPYQNDHEDANGQFEMNWDYDDCLTTADRHVFFKFMVKNIAEQHGYRATFMPKPFANLTGNGCHAHVSIWDKTGWNQPVPRRQ